MFSRSNSMTIPLPPSAHSKDRAAKKAWREDALRALKDAPDWSQTYLKLTIRLHYKYKRADGTPDPKAPDTDRLGTPIKDIIAKACGFNDRWVDWDDVRRIDDPAHVAVITVEAI